MNRVETPGELVSVLAAVGRAERGRYFWHDADAYVRLLAEFFLRRSNRSTVQWFLPAFVEAVPGLETLAVSDPAEVARLASWAGLRNRTRRLPELAAALLARPRWDRESLLELPHVGPYAAAGIALYVFDEPVFPVDNNVRRVLGRYLALGTEADVETAAGVLADEAMGLGGVEALKDVHRGVLALGWDPCAARPRCHRCPLSDGCSRSASTSASRSAA